MKDTYFPPKFEEKQFNCPHCGVYAHQRWGRSNVNVGGGVYETGLYVSECWHCRADSFWYQKRLIIPFSISVAVAHSDMPDDCKADFEEARQVFASSPRSSAALLRLCIQRLMPYLGERGNNINDDIKSLVSKGLPVEVQQALDFCRVVGNNAVHPGELNLQDTPETAQSLFGMVNFIVEDRIARPKAIQALYSGLPESSRAAIAKRDGADSP